MRIVGHLLPSFLPPLMNITVEIIKARKLVKVVATVEGNTARNGTQAECNWCRRLTLAMGPLTPVKSGLTSSAQTGDTSATTTVITFASPSADSKADAAPMACVLKASSDSMHANGAAARIARLTVTCTLAGRPRQQTSLSRRTKEVRAVTKAKLEVMRINLLVLGTT